MSIKTALTFAVMSAISYPIYAETPVRDVQNTLREWVRVEKQISEEKNTWLLEKEILTDSLRVLEETQKQLEESIKTSRESASAAETVRAELTGEKEALQEVSRMIGTSLDSSETEILELVKRLPPALQKEIDILVRRIPTDAESAGRTSIAVRMQNLVGILNQIDKWNSTVSVINEVQEVSGGAREVRTLYFGLGAAYYVDGNSEMAGYAVPTAEGWNWVADNSLAPTVTRLLAVYDNMIQATFVGLPAQIR